MGANESQPLEQEYDITTPRTAISDEMTNKSEWSIVRAGSLQRKAPSPSPSPSSDSQSTTSTPASSHELLSRPPSPPPVKATQSVPHQSDGDQVQLEQNLAQAEDELNEIRRKTLERMRINALRKEKEILRAAGKPKSKTRVRKTEPPPAPVMKATPSEATLAYLVHSLQSNLRHQHIHVITHQIELLKAKMDDFRREKEKEARVEEKRREEEQKKEWLRTMNNVDANMSGSMNAAFLHHNPTIPSDVIETNIPDAKKVRHEHEAAVEPRVPSFGVDPSFQQQSSPNFSHSQFQQIRDTIAREEVYSYPNDDEEMYSPFMHQRDDEQDQQQEPTNYDAIYARMNEIIQQDTDRDTDMTGESQFSASILSVTSTPTALTTTTTTPPTASCASVLPLTSSMMEDEHRSNLLTPLSSHPLLSTRSQVSRVILDICFEEVIKLEDAYISGKMSFDEMRFSLTMLHNVLIPEHERELIDSFEKIKIANSVESGQQENDIENDNESSTATTIRRVPESIVNRTLLSVLAYNDTFTPDLAVDDDSDGIARIRNNIFVLNPSSQIQTTTQQGQMKRKKHLKRLDSNEPVSSASSSSAPNASSTSSLSFVQSSPSPSPPSPTNGGPFSLGRMHYVNHAFEQLFGFAQSDIKGGYPFYDLTLRKDHTRAAQRLRIRWWTEKVIDSMMYEVRVKKDGTFIYCLVHWRVSFLQGKLRQMVWSFLPLPDDPEHPMPPYVEGVDLDVDTLLYGYKPPVTAKV